MANALAALSNELAAAVEEAENSEEEGDGREQEHEDSVAQCLRALGAGGGGVLVAHGAALGGCLGG